MDEFLKMFASLFSQDGEATGNDKPAHHNLVSAQSFAAAAQMIQASLGDGVSLVAELRQRSKEIGDVADLVEASLEDLKKKGEDKGQEQDKETGRGEEKKDE